MNDVSLVTLRVCLLRPRNSMMNRIKDIMNTHSNIEADRQIM